MSTQSPASDDPIVLRPCRPEDAPAIVALIKELAVYEKLEVHAKATPEQLVKHMFGPRPYAEAVIAEKGDEPVGFALYFFTYSTFRAQPSLYLEDLFVRPAYRGQGVGKRLLLALASIALERECGRMEWAVLDWNEPAIGFYRSLGAQPMDEWTTFRLEDEAFRKAAALGTLK